MVCLINDCHFILSPTKTLKSLISVLLALIIDLQFELWGFGRWLKYNSYLDTDAVCS